MWLCDFDAFDAHNPGACRNISLTAEQGGVVGSTNVTNVTTHAVVLSQQQTSSSASTTNVK